ncbi:MAG: DUF1990 family protein, partial [Gemmatimonadetes bacterium]|nr:DUF1990 family protein [Gemmatimonadota bacterium]
MTGVGATPGERPRGVAILGATGSIGASALAVVAQHSDRFRVVGLSANRNAAALAALLRRQGRRVGVMKPVETGLAPDDTESDAVLLREAGGGEDAMDVVRPVLLPEPLAPWVAAERAGTAVDLAGPEVTSMRELIQLMSRITQRSPVMVPVPEFLAKTGTQAMETLGLDFPIHNDQITMLLEGNVLPPGAPNALTDVFGVTPTPLGEGLSKLADALPEALPSEGTGSLHRQRYWADIQGSRMTADQVFEMVRTQLASLAPDPLMKVGVEPGTEKPIEEGATLTLSIPLRGHIQVRCMEIANNTITMVTLEGHPLSGAIRFDVEEPAPGIIRFEVRSFTRSSDLVDLVGMR